MPVAFIANALGAANSTTSFSITLPTTQAGDILILEFAHRGTGDGNVAGTSVTVGGLTWALKHSQLFGASAFSGKTYWTRATGDHAGQTVTSNSLTNSCAAILTQYRGALASGDPLADATIVGEQNASGNVTQAQITTGTNGAWVVLVVVNSPDLAVATQACTSPGTLTERAERLSTGGTDSSIAHASAEKATAGATGSFTWTQTNAASGSWAYAIEPAGAVEITGTGTIGSQASTLDGAGVSGSTGTGALQAQSASLAGEGTVGTPAITGTGALAAGASAIDGAGLSLSTGAGDLAAQDAAVDGAGVSASAGAGALAAQVSVVDGAGVSESNGTGALQAGDSTITGSEGIAAITGSGDLVASAALLLGVGEVSDSVTGIVVGAEVADRRRLRRRGRRADPLKANPPQAHPDEIVRQQREDQRYLTELEKKNAPPSATVAKGQLASNSSSLALRAAPVPKPILADVATRAASAVQAKVEEAETAAIALAKQERRYKALLLLALL